MESTQTKPGKPATEREEKPEAMSGEDAHATVGGTGSDDNAIAEIRRGGFPGDQGYGSTS